MDSAVGHDEASKLLRQVIEESESEEKHTQDYGCICEIDLSQVSTIKSIMAKMVQRMEDGSTLQQEKEAKNASQNKEETKDQSDKVEKKQLDDKGLQIIDTTQSADSVSKSKSEPPKLIKQVSFEDQKKQSTGEKSQSPEASSTKMSNKVNL